MLLESLCVLDVSKLFEDFIKPSMRLIKSGKPATCLRPGDIAAKRVATRTTLVGLLEPPVRSDRTRFLTPRTFPDKPTRDSDYTIKQEPAIPVPKQLVLSEYSQTLSFLDFPTTLGALARRRASLEICEKLTIYCVGLVSR